MRGTPWTAILSAGLAWGLATLSPVRAASQARYALNKDANDFLAEDAAQIAAGR